MNLNLTILTVCPFCGTENEIKVNMVDYWEWVNEGKLVQNAFPYLSADEREMLISGICPKCWESTFSSSDEEEEEEEDYEDDFDYDFRDEYLEIGFNPYMGCYDFDC